MSAYLFIKIHDNKLLSHDSYFMLQPDSKESLIFLFYPTLILHAVPLSFCDGSNL